MDYSRRIEQAVNLIKEAKRITAFTGAGVSTESGISDFRSLGGVWSKKGTGRFIMARRLGRALLKR